jgi:alpha-mannosidase
VTLGVANSLDLNHPAKGHLLNALNAAFNRLDLREPFGDDFYASITEAHEILRDGIAKAGPPMDVSIVGAGHAHIDVAWLWTLAQTRRKAGRTFHTVLRLMEEFPDYHFTQSQPQLYDYVRQDYPELFEDIKEAISGGRWETIGGMWVEADCNLSGPESLARQFLLGRAFYREHFGADVDSPVLWLPDVFGYAWNLPQLIKEAGLEYFFTIKIGWSQYNRLPYDSFWWQGLDGTQVLTHFSTTPEGGSAYASTYNAKASPEQAFGTWTNFQQKEQQSELLMAYGYGDGGGGPTREMLENIELMGDFPAAPQMRAGKVIDFYRNLEATSGDELPVLERRTLPGDPPGHLHHPEPQQARQPQERIPAARRRVPGDAGQPCRPWVRLPGREAAQSLGAGLPQPVPRHHPRQQHQPCLHRFSGAVRRDPANWEKRYNAPRSPPSPPGMKAKTRCW